MITLIIALILFYFFQNFNPYEAIATILPSNLSRSFIYGGIFAFIVVIVDVLLSWNLPKEMFDDGGINEKLFKNMPIWHIFIITNIVGFVEELLFRGAIQPLLGVWFTSLIFALIHFRYLKKIVLILVTFSISIGLGLITEHTGSWFSAYIAHMLIDFILGIFIRKNWL